jgi:hypothetical protein
VASDPLVGSPRVASDPLVLSVSKDEPPAPTIDREIDTAHPEVFSSALERSRSAVWPLVLALIVGIAVGFAGGYGVGSRDRTTPPPTAAAAPPPPAGREFTESAVPAAPATSPRSQAPSPAPLRERRTPGAEPPAPAGIGRLLVRSTPAGARVRVDGKDVGVTPSVVRDLAPGAHRVEVAREGYAAVERRVVITGARPAQSLALSLARVAVSSATPALATPGTMGHFVGSLSVDSRPAGAKVFLDDKLIGTTPLAMASVTAGEHAVRLEYTGYRRWSSSVRVVASEQNRVTASLER